MAHRKIPMTQGVEWPAKEKWGRVASTWGVYKIEGTELLSRRQSDRYELSC